jgi:predicted AAA+ superfamily ATPase
MKYIQRLLEKTIRASLHRNKSVLLLGARQTGKTTLINRLNGDLLISFVRPDVRQRYEKNPAILAGEVEALKPLTSNRRPLVLLDEIQKIPAIMDVVQDLIDRKTADFILTGSSARKLRRGTHTNLLPGRVISLRLDAFNLREFPDMELKDLLLYGSLPGITAVGKQTDKERDLSSYVTSYLEEEVRAEALVRNIGSFARFLEYAASESGCLINFNKLSQEIGVSHVTIASYYQILEDCLIAERIEPLSKSRTRKKLTKTDKYLFFDLGVRRLAAQEGVRLPREAWGNLFEQFVGLELLRYTRLTDRRTKIRFWRDPDGPELDWIIETDSEYIPVEVKWTDSPSVQDIRHIQVFHKEHRESKKGYLVCRVPRKVSLAKNITALPWRDLPELIFV